MTKSSRGHPRVHSGVNGQLLKSFAPNLLNVSNGALAKGAFDLNLDGQADVLLGFDKLANGGARMHSVGYNQPTTYCTAKLNSQFRLPAIVFSGAPNAVVGTDSFILTASQVIGNQIGMLLWSRSSASIPLWSSRTRDRAHRSRRR